MLCSGTIQWEFPLALIAYGDDLNRDDNRIFISEDFFIRFFFMLHLFDFNILTSEIEIFILKSV